MNNDSVNYTTPRFVHSFERTTYDPPKRLASSPVSPMSTCCLRKMTDLVVAEQEREIRHIKIAMVVVTVVAVIAAIAVAILLGPAAPLAIALIGVVWSLTMCGLSRELVSRTRSLHSPPARPHIVQRFKDKIPPSHNLKAFKTNVKNAMMEELLHGDVRKFAPQGFYD